MPMRLPRTRSRACAVCTAKRPASTGARPSRLLRTQSVGGRVSNVSAAAAAPPAADAMSARTAASSGGARKWTARDHRPEESSKAEAANCPAARLSASTSAILRTVPASLERRATAVAPQLGDDPGIKLLDRIPDIHRHLCTTDRRGLGEWSTAYSLIVHTPPGIVGSMRALFVGHFAASAVILHRTAPQRSGLAARIRNQ